jgi:hypothetical protein
MALTNFPNGVSSFGIPVLGGPSVYGNYWFVDTERGSDGNTGKSRSKAFSTMSKALSVAGTSDVVFLTGDCREELTGSNLVFDLTIVGCGNSPHHPDLPATGYRSGAATWRPPASPTAATPLIKVRGRGWRFVNILFDAPVDAAAIYLERNASSGTDEYDGSHASILGCRFDAGKVGIENAGGCGFTTVKGNFFRGLSESGGAGIKCTSTSVAVPLAWTIEDNRFANNASHILSSMSYSTIKGNTFGRFTATLSVDIDDQPSANQGEYNVIWGNYLSGTYGATAYPPGSNNEWAGNFNSLTGGVTADDPA